MKRNFLNILLALMLGLVFTLSGVTAPGVAYAADGDLDTTFNLDGKLTTDFATSRDRAYGVAIQADGKIVAVGETYTEETGWDFAVARYTHQGLFDIGINGGGFGGGDGKVRIDFGWSDNGTSVAIQADGKIVVVGRVQASHSRWDFGIARLNSNGTLDTTFSGDGKTTVGFSGTDGPWDEWAWDVEIQADGKIVVGGWTRETTNSDNIHFAVVRLRTNGLLDNTFSSDGKVIVDFGSHDEGARGLAIQADGKIVVVGAIDSADPNNDFNYDFAIARLNSNGTLDTTFSGDGKVSFDLGGYDDTAIAIAIQADGKIVAAGRTVDFSGNGDNGAFAFVRLNTDGSFDTSFSGDGKVTFDFGNHYDEARAIAIQADGKIVAAGVAFNSDGTRAFAISRVSADGNLDTSFSGDGKVTFDFGNHYDEARAIAIQADGKIVAAGYSLMIGSDFALVRLQASPSP